LTERQAGTQNQHARNTSSVDETVALGEVLGRSLVGGLMIALIGPLGAGKTQLVKGIAAGNATGNSRNVTSPTFTLVHEYTGRLHLYHVDAYRLRTAQEFNALGFDEWLQPDAAVVIEWADRVRAALPQDGLWVELETTGETTRRIMFSAVGAPARTTLARLRTDSH
jgi:tRNA threonylcarbamoyladenosine biosynthesis protein TsaE